MASFVFQTGATDKTITVRAYDSTTFLPKTALVYNSAGMSCYFREAATGAATALTLATQTVGGAHSDGGFILIDDTNMPGVYRLDLSDTILNSGAGSLVSIHLKATGVIFEPIDIVLTADDPTSAAATVAQIADAVHDEQLSDHPTAGSAGKALADTETDAGTASANSATLITTVGTPADTSIATDIANVQAVVDALLSAGVLVDTTIATVNSQTDLLLTAGAPDDFVYARSVAVFTDAATALQKAVVPVSSYTNATKNLTLAAAPQFTVAVTDRVQIVPFAGYSAIEEAVLVTISNNAYAIKAKTDNLPSDPADQSAVEAAITAATSPLATAAALATVDSEVGVIDGLVDLIKAKTDNLPTDPADQSAVEAAITAAAGLDAAGVRAAVGLASANLDTQLSTIDTVVDGVKAKTDNLPADPADQSALEAVISNLDGDVAAVAGAVATLPTAEEFADTLLDRRQTGGATGSSGDRVKDALAPGLMKFSGLGTATLTVLDAEDNTAFTRDITRSGSVLLPVTSSEE